MWSELNCFPHWIIFATILQCSWADPISNSETLDISRKITNSLNQQTQNTLDQQQLQQVHNQNAHLNSLNAYASSYDNQRPTSAASDGDFRPSFKLPEMEHNFTPLQNTATFPLRSSTSAQQQEQQLYQINGPPEALPTASNIAAPQLIHYVAPVTNDQGVRYVQLIPTRPMLLPVGQFLTANAAYASLPHPNNINNNNYIDYAQRPLALLNGQVVPVSKAPLFDVSLKHMPGSYGMLSYGSGSTITNYKPNFRINREIRDKGSPSSISLNLNEYMPPTPTKISFPFINRGRR